MPAPPSAQIMLRPGYADDEAALRRLAALDSARLPSGLLLVAEVDGELRAALSTDDGSAISDPFYPSAALVALLRAHAAPSVRVSSRRRRRLRPRLAHS